MNSPLYQYTLPPGGHWSLRVRRGLKLRFRDISGRGNLGALMFNPENLLEKYNAPDTLKCQHTFKLHQGHCLYSDMGRIFCSIVEDDFAWHDTVCGNSHSSHISQRWGARDYQTDRNQWQQNGNDAFLVEMAKYGLGPKDLVANLNLFSKTYVGPEGQLGLDAAANKEGASVTLRFEMDTLLILHACPHPLNSDEAYPQAPIDIEIFSAQPPDTDDECMNHCEENKRGFANNRLYYLGVAS